METQKILKREFAIQLKNIRKKKGFTGERLGELSGVSRSYISDIELQRGTIPSKEIFEKIIIALSPIPDEDKKKLYNTYLKLVVPPTILSELKKGEI